MSKTVCCISYQLWLFNFGTTGSAAIAINKKHEDAKLNLQRLKEYREALPSYLQMDAAYGRDNKKVKASNTVEYLEHPLNGNNIKTLASARNKVAANSLGRGLSVTMIHFDEYAFIPYNGIIYLAAAPAFKTAAMNAKKNGVPYGMLITTTPGDLTTEEGAHAFTMYQSATKFNEMWYDMTPQHLEELVANNTNSSFVLIEFDYLSLGRTEAWFRSIVIDMNKDWSAIRREVLLEWAKVSDNSPFRKEDLNIVKQFVKQPIRQIPVCNNFYFFNVYEDIMDMRRYPPLAGVDVSGGFQRDSSTITIIDSRTTRVTADFNNNHISPIDLAKVIYELVTKYMPNAVVNIERNGGFGASVIARLKDSSIKRNLYWEIKDRVIEERQMGMQTVRKTVKTKVYGLDSTKSTREELMEILRQRVEFHKDKFISPQLLAELETLEVKKNGRIEHSSNGHDDQVFSYLLALYIYYNGTDLKEKYGINKTTIKTDEELDENITGIESSYMDIFEELSTIDDSNPAQVKEQLDILNSHKSMSYDEWLNQEQAKDDDSMRRLVQTRIGQKAYKEKYQDDPSNVYGTPLFKIPDSVFNQFNND